jgi:hypothetical protein
VAQALTLGAVVEAPPFDGQQDRTRACARVGAQHSFRRRVEGPAVQHVAALYFSK